MRIKFFLRLGLFAVCISLLMGCTSYNQATGRNEFIFISTEQEISMGRDVHKALSKKFEFTDSHSYLKRVQRIGRRVAAVSDRQDYRYSFYVVDKDELNAFTVPGGRVYIFTGLLDKLKTDDQVASVLAHEVGHCAAKHVVKKYQAALGYNLIGSIAASQIGDGSSAGSTLLRGSNTVMSLVFSAYSRHDEYESDRLGIKYMLKAGYDPKGMIEAFGVLLDESKGGQVPTLMRSHPHLQDRIVKAVDEIKIQKGY